MMLGMLTICKPVSAGSGYRPTKVSCEHVNDPSSLYKREKF